MRVTKEQAIEKTKQAYKTIKNVLSESGGKIIQGATAFIQQATGFDKISMEDIEYAWNHTEDEFLKRILPRFYPSHFNPQKNTETSVDYTERLNAIEGNIISLGKMMVKILERLDAYQSDRSTQAIEIIEIGHNLLKIWSEEPDNKHI